MTPTSPRKYRKRPVVVAAWQLARDNADDILAWISAAGYSAARVDRGAVNIKTLEGVMRADVGDWIIRGVNGEFYPCKPDIFAKTYEVSE